MDVILFLKTTPPFTYSALTLFALIIGSFLNVVIYRYPKMLMQEWRSECQEFLEVPIEQSEKINLATPRSHCPHCQQQISAYDNIPLFSFLLLKGKCRHCKNTISPRYFFVELLTAISSIIILASFGVTQATALALLLTYILIVLSFIDLQHKLLPDTLTIVPLWIGLLINFNGLFTTLENAVFAAVLGYLVLWTTNYCFEKIRKKTGMGHGDFKMLAMLGAWLGPFAMLNSLFIAVIIGLLVSLTLLLLKKIDAKHQIPFGPFIALGGWLSLLLGPFVIHYFIPYI